MSKKTPGMPWKLSRSLTLTGSGVGIGRETVDIDGPPRAGTVLHVAELIEQLLSPTDEEMNAWVEEVDNEHIRANPSTRIAMSTVLLAYTVLRVAREAATKVREEETEIQREWATEDKHRG